jgi:type IV pilus assembly protein PilA
MGRRGFTLAELMAVVSIVSILAVLAIYGVRKYIANSKTTEARNSLGMISKNAAIAFEHESSGSVDLTPGLTSNITRALCPTSSLIPSSGAPRAVKYQSAAAEWDSNAGWKCLRFTMQEPQYFAYRYSPSDTTQATGAYVATAQGDLDGNGSTSQFSIAGKVQDGVLTAAPSIGEVNPEE